jgi:hypothetical protein
LNLPISKTANKYPYQDTVRDLIEGEIWRTIPGFDGFYEVSDQGRVRSLDRVVEHPRLFKQFVKGRILRQSVSFNKNKVTDVPMVDLRVSLARQGKQYYFNTRRLVYSAFIKKISFADDSLNIVHNDCDGYNCRSSNLLAFAGSQKQKRVFNRGRIHNYLKHADRSQWTKPHGGQTRRKRIVMLKDGEQIAEYPSIREASRDTGYGEKEIIGVAKGRYRKWDGYVWQYL